jgi:hypothetical protein
MSDTKVLKQQESLSTALPIMSTIPDSLRPSSYLSHPPLPQLNPATTAPSSNQRLEAIGPTPLSPLQGFFPHTGSRLTVEVSHSIILCASRVLRKMKLTRTISFLPPFPHMFFFSSWPIWGRLRIMVYSDLVEIPHELL